MNKLYFFLIFSTLYSCSNSENVAGEPNKEINITIGNESFVINDQIQLASNENCNGIFVTGKYNGSDDSLGFRISFRLTKHGAIDNIKLNNYQEAGKQYESADFNAIKTIQIKNFIYNASTNYLHFEFEGNLVFVDSNLYTVDVPKPQKFIKGEVNFINVKKTNCTTSLSILDFEIPTLKFSTVKDYGEYNPSLLINPYQLNYYSDNGYKISFTGANDLWNLPLGQYNFNQSDVENRVNFQKYIGNERATQLLWIRPIDWKMYTTSGNYTVQEHVLENNQKLTKGLINLNIYEAGNLIYQINNIKFQSIGL